MSALTVALWTPPGRAAVATLVVRGPSAWDRVRALFTRRSGQHLPQTPRLNAVWVGKLGASGLADDVVLGVTRQDEVEIHCHGGPAVVQMIQQALAGCGVAPVAWEDQERRRGTPEWKVEALRLLSQAPTARTAGILLEQLRLWEHCGSPDITTLQEALRWERFGTHLASPWRVVVGGAPNVGKSTLVNAIAGYERCVVSEQAGTTRDVVDASLAIDGWPVLLVDTAGLRQGAGALEHAGMALAREQLDRADLCIWVVQTTAPPQWPGELSCPVLRVINKVDQDACWPLESQAGAHRVSALTGAGVATLRERIAATLVPETPSASTLIALGPAGVDWIRSRLPR